MMNDNQILCFLEAAREKNFTKAADNLFLTQPGISRTIASLEKELNSKLFFRFPNKKIELTECGKLYYDLFNKYHTDFISVKEKCKQMQTHSPLNIRLGYAIGWSISAFLPKILNTLNEKYPYLNISLECHEFDDLSKLLYEDRLDVILTLKNRLIDMYNLDYKEICILPKIILYSKNNEHIPKVIKSPEDFKNQPFYIYESKISSDMKNELTTYFNNYGFTPNMVTVPNLESMISMVENGLGVAILDLWSQTIYMNQFNYYKLSSSHTATLAYRNNCANSEIIQSLYNTLMSSL